MKATTIKIENPLLDQLKGFVPKDKSLSAYIREVLEKEIQRKKMIQASEEYIEFLNANPDEENWLSDWESSDLLRAPRKIQKRKKR